jgi:hypothetical protein
VTDDEKTTPNETTENAQTTDAHPGGQQGDGERTFTQDEVDRIAGERAVRAKQKVTNDLLGDLGIENVDTLKRLISAQRDAEEAEKTELQKAEETIETLGAQVKQAEQQAREMLLRAEVQAEATKQGFRNPAVAYRLADLSAIEIGEDGSVAGVDAALKALAENEPYLLGGDGGETPKPPAPNTDAGQGSVPQSGGAALTSGEQAAIAAAQQSGFKIDPDAVAKVKARTRLARHDND